MKILHLVSDEKFIHFIADVFNVCEEVSNTFYVIVQDVFTPLKHISGLLDMHLIDNKKIRSGTVKKDIIKYDAIIVHSLDKLKATILLMAPPNIPVVWSGWGADYYCFIGNGEEDLLGKESLALKKQFNNQLNCSNILTLVKNCTKHILRPSFDKALRGTNYLIRKAIRRSDYFSSPIPDDYDLLKIHLRSNFRAKYMQINYGSVEKTFCPGPVSFIGNDILVGNSATLPNNHFEILRMLSTINLGARKIVAPLSYGNPSYRDAVIEQGYSLFGDAFYPIVDFMPLDQYNALISSCSLVVMGHRRQQAVGNTATMLYKGTKVFLDETSTVYHFLKKRGAIVYGLNELKDYGQSALAPLSYDQKSKNREVLELFWGHNVVLNNTQDLLETLRLHKGSTSA